MKQSSDSHRHLVAGTQPRGATPPDVGIGDVLEALPDAVVIVDGDGRIVYLNSLVERMSGYRADELVGKPVELLVPDRFHQVHVGHRRQYTQNPRVRPMGVNLQISMKRKDGTEFPADISLSPLQTPSGPNIVAAVRDATDRQRLALVEDRERIAKELHDGVIQGLFAVGMTLQATQARADSPDDVRARLEGAIESIDAAIRDLRNYIFGLRPGILADRQLDAALRQLAAEFEERSGILVVVEVDPAMASHLAPAAAQVVQIAREALSNVARHAQATTCRLTLTREEEHAVLAIDDDGGGFDQAAVRAEGQGLRNMRDRARALRGDVVVVSTIGEGTRVEVRLPL